MRKGAADGQSATIRLTLQALLNLEKNGFKYVQVKGLTMDRHYDYIEPHWIMLVPIKELPTAQINKDIYEPLDSELLREWASDVDQTTQILISENK
ncbi:MAG: hypothetical protein ABIQ31_23080 [Ferruginibacter sp.]